MGLPVNGQLLWFLSAWGLEAMFGLTKASEFLDPGKGNLEGDTGLLAPVSIVERHETSWKNEMQLLPGLIKYIMPVKYGGTHFTLIRNL